MAEQSSKIFAAFRALGVNSDHVPCVVRYNQNHQENYAITSVGKAFHVYKCSNMGLVRVSDSLEHDITSLGADASFIYASSKNKIYAFKYGRKIVKVFEGHESDVVTILPFGAHLISLDQNNVIIIWNIEASEVYLTLNFANESFNITSILHPITYLNKILLGSQQGSMQLWNIKTSQLVYSFKSFNSQITILKQAPAIDVVGIGLENGRIILHNLKYDETIMSFVQEWGPVRSLTFRTDGNPIMISGSLLGHMAIWNLEEKRLVGQLREAHNSSVDGLQSLQFEPLMVSSSADNSLKIWIFDMSDGSARLLRQRSGHYASPIRIRFHDQNGQKILSSGLDSNLLCFSTEHESKNKSLGRASFNKIETKKSGLKLDQHKMPPIVDFASSEAKQSDWDNIICIHENLRMATTWDVIKSSMGKYKIDHPRFKTNEKFFSSVIATCCTISNCGNFCLIGYSSGHVDLYNMQSGLFRGSYGSDTAHDSSVRGVATDFLNQTTITCSELGQIKFWPFKEKKKLNSNVAECRHQIQIDENISSILLHRESGMLSIATDDFSVLIIDCDVKKIVRKFAGHSNKISDMAFSSDSRWLLTSSMDCLIKVWDIPSGKLIDCFKFDLAPTSICLSPSSEFLATTHVNELGVFLWSNKTLYSHVSLRQLPDDYVPEQNTKMPSTKHSSSEELDGQEPMEQDDVNSYKIYISPEQIDLDLVTLSLLPESRWKNLINLDIIKQRNKPKEPPKVPKSAPFFLPTISNLQGFTFNTAIETRETSDQKATSINLFLSDFATNLLKSKDSLDYELLLSEMKKMGPSALDMEVRSLSEDMGGSIELMEKFMQYLLYLMTTRKNFELANSYLALFLKVHADTISLNDDLVTILEKIKEVQSVLWANLHLSFNKNLCLVSYLKSVT